MTNINVDITQVKAEIGSKLYDEMQRLEPVKGSVKGRFVKTIENEFNRFVNIFKTGHFTTDAQICTLLDKQVRKLDELMHKTENQFGGTRDPKMIEHQLFLRHQIAETTDKILDLMHKTGARSGKSSKEFKKLEKNIGQLMQKNQMAIQNESHFLKHLSAGGKGKDRQRELSRSLKDFLVLTQRHGLTAQKLFAVVAAPITDVNVERMATLARSTFIQNAEDICSQTRSFYRTNGQQIPGEVNKELENLEVQIVRLKGTKPTKLAKLNLAPQKQIARKLPAFIKEALLLTEVKKNLTLEQMTELKALMETDLQPPASPEEVARIAKKATQMISELLVEKYVLPGKQLPKELTDLSKQLDALKAAIGKLPILQRAPAEEPSSTHIARERPIINEKLASIIDTALEEYGLNKHLTPGDIIVLSIFRTPKLANALPPDEFSGRVKEAITLIARTYIENVGMLPRDFEVRLVELQSHVEQLGAAAEKTAKFKAAGKAIEAQRARKTLQREPVPSAEELHARREKFKKERIAPAEENMKIRRLGKPPRPPEAGMAERRTRFAEVATKFEPELQAARGRFAAKEATKAGMKEMGAERRAIAAVLHDAPVLIKKVQEHRDFDKSRFPGQEDDRFFADMAKMTQKHWSIVPDKTMLGRVTRLLDLIEERGFLSTGIPREIQPLFDTLRDNIRKAGG